MTRKLRASLPDQESARIYVLGTLIRDLENHERQISPEERGRRRDSTPSRKVWIRDEARMPGIGRIELLCDREPGDAGITAAKVRRLRARACRLQDWQTTEFADALSLNETADLLEGIRRVSLNEFHQAAENQLALGLAVYDRILISGDQRIDVTGLSCKVIPGKRPTACPNARPVLPPGLLGLAERAVRRLNPLPEGTTIHWVGHDAGMRNRCLCHPLAPFAAPFDRDKWGSVAIPPMPEVKPNAKTKKVKKGDHEQDNIRVERFLLRFKDDPDAVSIQMVSKEIGKSTGYVSGRMTAWKAFVRRRESKRQERKDVRRVPLSERMLATVWEEDVGDSLDMAAEIESLTREQAAEEEADERRRSKRRRRS